MTKNSLNPADSSADTEAQQAMEGTDHIRNDDVPTRDGTKEGPVQKAVEDLDGGLSVEPDKD